MYFCLYFDFSFYQMEFRYFALSPSQQKKIPRKIIEQFTEVITQVYLELGVG